MQLNDMTVFGLQEDGCQQILTAAGKLGAGA
jgi:hypothetical protein